jgi:hypothetical protein
MLDLNMRREAIIINPDGNWICLYRAGNNRKHPPWRVARTVDGKR